MIDDDVKWTKVRGVTDAFPGLGQRLDDVDGAHPLLTVNDLVAREADLTGASMHIGKTPRVDVSGRSSTNHARRARTRPVAVELSCRYCDMSELDSLGVSTQGLRHLRRGSSGSERVAGFEGAYEDAFVFDRRLQNA